MDNGERVILPEYDDVKERISFVEELIEKYPNDFRYTLRNESKGNITHGRIVCNRLDLLATYILASDKGSKKFNKYPTQSQYKKKQIRRHEISCGDVDDLYFPKKT